MRDKSLPCFALWLIKVSTREPYRNSLLGDVIELRRAGKSRLWCWRQAMAALLAGLLRGLRRAPVLSAIKAAILALAMLTFGASTLSWASAEVPCVVDCPAAGAR